VLDDSKELVGCGMFGPKSKLVRSEYGFFMYKLVYPSENYFFKNLPKSIQQAYRAVVYWIRVILGLEQNKNSSDLPVGREVV
jgi:hypothetical protein